MKNVIKAILPAPVKNFARYMLKNFNLVNESPDSILIQAYQRIGILNYKNNEISGEAFLLHKIIPKLISKSNPIVFDVGANVGNYTNTLLNVLPKAKIHAFEPSPETFAVFTKKVTSNRVVGVMKGLNDQSRESELFDHSDRLSSDNALACGEHASLHGDVLSELHHASRMRKFTVVLTTLDQYCSENNLINIDFLKIDTEGNELAVLLGAKRLIESGGLPLIQFEFNEMNVISRVFLKDFYLLLKGYKFFRLMPNGILPLERYTPKNEIFAFQNILAYRVANYKPDFIQQFVVSASLNPPKIK